MRKASDVLFTVSIYVRDVANEKIIHQGSSEIYGNTDKMWLARGELHRRPPVVRRQGHPQMIDRRRVLVGRRRRRAGELRAAGDAGAVPPDTLRVASLKFGSLSWLLETIRAEGFADKLGLNITIVEVATNQAGPVALLSGEADVIVSDWPWALRQRAMGEHVKFAPYSSALGRRHGGAGLAHQDARRPQGQEARRRRRRHRQELAAAACLFAPGARHGHRAAGAARPTAPRRC